MNQFYYINSKLVCQCKKRHDYTFWARKMKTPFCVYKVHFFRTINPVEARSCERGDSLGPLKKTGSSVLTSTVKMGNLDQKQRMSNDESFDVLRTGIE